MPSELATTEDGDDMENDSPPARPSELHLEGGRPQAMQNHLSSIAGRWIERVLVVRVAVCQFLPMIALGPKAGYWILVLRPIGLWGRWAPYRRGLPRGLRHRDEWPANDDHRH